MDIKLNVSSENLINIIETINNIKKQFDILVENIKMIDMDETWVCNSSKNLKNIFIEKLSVYQNECDEMKFLIKKIIENLNNYKQVDQKLIRMFNE